MTIACALCGKTSDTGEGWTRIQVSTAPLVSLDPLVTRGDDNEPTVVYCEPQHVQGWFTRAGLPKPVPIP